ncbi:hypothetical protein BBJ28_00008682 [Nothophytophthora sp. Chile5]|nr:hypothetical protein BBJ28_00008682 [Nothophytophthora sp. Chile5]
MIVVFQLASYKPHFDAHLAKNRILRDLQTRPALRLSFQLKRRSMLVHGASTFDVLVTPASMQSADDNSMVYNGLATFEDDEVTHEYTLVDGIAYYTTRVRSGDADAKAGCIPSGFVPPIGTVLRAIDTATTASHLIDEVKAKAECPNGALLEFSFDGEPFLLCSHRASFSSLRDEGFKIFGEDLNIDVHFEQSIPVIAAPTMPTDVAMSCGKVPANEAISPSTFSFLTRTVSEWGHRSLRAEKANGLLSSLASALSDDDDDSSDDSSSTCSTTKRPCVFVAGLGSSVDYGLSATDALEYFGDEIQDNAPCCSSIKYIQLATDSYAWYDATIMQRLATLLVQVSSSSSATTGTISDTIIFAHSVANNILAGAIANGLCSLGSSATWVAASAPMSGSMGSDYLQEACDGTLTDVVADILSLLNECPAITGRVALSYQGESYASSTLDAAYTKAQAAYSANVDAVMCSSSASGLASTLEAVYILAREVIPHKSDDNDGIVEYDSCAKGLSTSGFDDTYTSTNYLTKLNHADTTFRNGDSLFSSKKKPMKWFKNLFS